MINADFRRFGQNLPGETNSAIRIGTLELKNIRLHCPNPATTKSGKDVGADDMTMTAQKAPDLASEQRASERVGVRLEGKLFGPAEETSFDCLIVDLSPGGAGIRCEEPPPLNTFVVLYITGFGRFDGVATRYVRGELGLHFVCKEAQRKHLEQSLDSYLKEGLIGVTRLRRFRRSTAREPLDRFTRTDGSVIPCELIDISLQGVSVRTEVHPPIGEVIELGLTKGWVIRHFQDCIGVQLLQHPSPAASDVR